MTYNYSCSECSIEFEVSKTVEDRHDSKCPYCGNTVDNVRVYTSNPPAVIFNGAGFYCTDHRK